MTPEQIAADIRYARDVEGANPRTAFLALADLAVSMLRMIDSRRESGIKFEASYNEDTLRIAVEPLATQEFPPGPPMTLAEHHELSYVSGESVPSAGSQARKIKPAYDGCRDEGCGIHGGSIAPFRVLVVVFIDKGLVGVYAMASHDEATGFAKGASSFGSYYGEGSSDGYVWPEEETQMRAEQSAVEVEKAITQIVSLTAH